MLNKSQYGDMFGAGNKKRQKYYNKIKTKRFIA